MSRPRCRLWMHRKMGMTFFFMQRKLTLEFRAKEAGVTIMNEVGLDPGIDHMSAMKIIDEAKADGKKVRETRSVSFPEANTRQILLDPFFRFMVRRSPRTRGV